MEVHDFHVQDGISANVIYSRIEAMLFDWCRKDKLREVLEAFSTDAWVRPPTSDLIATTAFMVEFLFHAEPGFSTKIFFITRKELHEQQDDGPSSLIAGKTVDCDKEERARDQNAKRRLESQYCSFLGRYRLRIRPYTCSLPRKQANIMRLLERSLQIIRGFPPLHKRI